MSYQIITTLGPASQQPETILALIKAGATAFRLNISHLDYEDTQHWIACIQQWAPQIPLYLDLQGSKWRLGNFPKQVIHSGQIIELIFAENALQSTVIPVPHQALFQHALIGQNIHINDAKLTFKIQQIKAHRIVAQAQNEGFLASRKGIVLEAMEDFAPSLSLKEKKIIHEFGSNSNIRFAISYLKDAKELQHYRSFFESSTFIAAKIERLSAIQDHASIASLADEIWICRGDLGASVGISAMAKQCHQIFQNVRSFDCPHILAGQVFEHLTHHPQATRSEICHLYEALKAGFAGLVLSDETAVGMHPINACNTAAMFQGDFA